MESSSSSEEDNVPPAPTPAPTPAATPAAPKRSIKTVLSTRVTERQPVFGDTDDELGVSDAPIAVRKHAKTSKYFAKPAPVKRLFVCSAATFHAAHEAAESMNYKITAFPLNRALRLPTNVHQCHAYRGDAPAENFDVEELPAWDPGKAELAGIAVLAHEIADHLLETDESAAIIVSKKCGDAAKLLGACVAQVVRKRSPALASAILGGRASQPSAPLLKKIVERFKGWSATTARVEILAVEE